MDGGFRIVHADDPEWGIIGQGIGDYNEQQAGDDKSEYLCYVLYAPGQVIVGGVICEIHYEWLHVVLLWVKDELRGRGYGHQLLINAEQEARQRGVKNAYLDTFSFQAPDFYEQHGYEVFGELPDFPPGHQHHYLKKQL